MKLEIKATPEWADHLNGVQVPISDDAVILDTEMIESVRLKDGTGVTVMTITFDRPDDFINFGEMKFIPYPPKC